MNAAWKLAYVLNGRATDPLLDSYSPERRGATLDVFRNAGKSSRFMTPPSRGYAIMRKAVLELALTEEFTRPFADPRQVQPYTYEISPLTTADGEAAPFSSGPGPGASLLNCKLAEDDYLLDHIGAGFSLLYFSDEASTSPELTDLCASLRNRDPDFRLIRITARAAAGASEAVLVDRNGTAADVYGAAEGTLYLVRPDRHVAGRWKSVVPKRVVAAMQRALGETTG